MKPRSVNRELITLRSMFSRMVAWEYLQTHPMKGIKPLKAQERVPTFLMLDQLDRLFDACESQHLYTFVVLAAYTGLRKGEILSLKWDDVDHKRKEIAVQKTKTRKARSIPMNDLIAETLENHPIRIVDGKKCSLVLTRPDGKSYRHMTTEFEKALEKAELPRIRIHDLRHSFASNLVIAGMPLNVVQELMGHNDIKTTMIYAHLAPNARRAAVDALMRRDQEKETVRERAVQGQNLVSKY